MRLKKVFLLLAGLIFTLSPAHALKPGGHVKATLVSEVKSIQSGTPFWVAVRLEMQPHWHTYWKNAGESGEPTSIDWKLPEGFKAGPIIWPYPRTIAVPPVLSYGFEEEVLLLTRIDPPATFTGPKSIALAAHVNWLECQSTCIPGQADVALTLPLAAASPKVDAEWQQKFSSTRFEWPLQSSDWKVSVNTTSDGYRISLTPPEGVAPLSDLSFYAEDPAVINYSAPQKFQTGAKGATLDLVKSEASTETAKQLRGALITSTGWRGTGSEKALALDLPVEAGAAHGHSMPIALALAFSFIGGLILNLMPCVLPVLSIKILGFVKQAAGDTKAIFNQGVAFTMGVLVSFWTLAGLLLFLRASGQKLGWGFQLQSPIFVVCLAMLFFILGLSMLGVFEVGTSLIQLGGTKVEGSHLTSSFLSGMLATVVATPCTAPFMGSALGFALTQSPVISIGIFTALGLGMAAPYMLLSAFPPLLKFVPKPGAWMEIFKQVMGFFLIATVIWLVWVLGNQTDVNTVAAVLGALLLQSVAGWIYGKWGTPVQSPQTQRNAISAAAVLLIFGIALGVKAAHSAPSPMAEQKTGASLEWEPFSAERVTELRKQGRPVFVDFSASWCLTCQVNERVVLRRDDVAAAFKAKNIALLKADWTSHDDKITKALEDFGRSGVPFYVLYPSDPSAAPATLSEILSKEQVLDAISKTH